MWKKILQNIKEILFPVTCTECGIEGEWWCDRCRMTSRPMPLYVCPVCARNSPDGQCCESCRHESYLDGAVAFSRYEENSPIGKLIKQFKYNYAVDLVVLWEKIINEGWPKIKIDILTEPLAVVPIPLYSRRLRERGYNQAEVITKIIFAKISQSNSRVQWGDGILKRQRHTIPQAHLNRSKRLVNLKDAFVSTANVIPENILLIDDVLTTGSTMQECARVLKKHGAKHVWALTLARG